MWKMVFEETGAVYGAGYSKFGAGYMILQED
jgi:hypothetical protein